MSPIPNDRRIKHLDAARGTAMVLVCLSHFAAVYFRQAITGGPGKPAELPWPIALGMIASPAFVAVSGTLLGLLFVTRGESFAALRIKLIDRSLFVLTVAHVAIACSRLTYEAHPLDALRMTFMTDTIGICVIVGALMIGVTSRTVRVVLGLSCFVLAWRLLYVWSPDHTFDSLMKDVLVGGAPDRVLGYTVPLLPWFGVYIACSAFGEALGDLYRRTDLFRIEQLLLIAGLGTTIVGIALRCTGWVLDATVSFDPKVVVYWKIFFSPWAKLPPSPVYVLFFGGLGILLMWAVTFATHRGLASWFVSQVATLGRCSLAVFTLQFYVYYMLLGSLPLPHPVLWPMVYIATLALLLAFARWWDRNNFNSLLSVGLPGGLEWMRRTRTTPTSAPISTPPV